ncbi:MAG: hypothetical protein ACI9EB_001371, partial [Pseudomonas sp.]
MRAKLWSAQIGLISAKLLARERTAHSYFAESLHAEILS